MTRVSSFPRPLLALVAALSLAACQEEKKPPEKPAHPATAVAPAAKPEVNVLVTGDENGWLLPSDEDGKKLPGAAALLGKWIRDEGHCAKDAAAPCKDPGTLALTTGDHFNGQAISSFYFGEPAAQVMARMNYAASGLGNHELDFGLDAFVKDRETGGFPYVAANLTVEKDGPAQLQLKPFEIFERRGGKIAVIGLVFENAPKSVMADRFAGLSVQPYEASLATAIPAARQAGADAIVVLADDCPSVLEKAFEAHPDWKVDLLVGSHCQQAYEKKLGSTAAFSAGNHFDSYVRAHLTFDPAKPAGQRVAAIDAKRVEVGDAPADAQAAAIADSWKTKLDAAVGEVVGFTKAGIPQDSPLLGKLVTTAWRDTLQTDVALVNKRAIRQGLPAGEITKASIYSALPFENGIMVVKLPGDALAKALANENAVYSGATKAGAKFKDASGKPLDPKKTYTVATIDFVYFGGDGFEIEKYDPEPVESGMVWQTPVISWTKKQDTSAKKPLEAVLKGAKK